MSRARTQRCPWSGGRVGVATDGGRLARRDRATGGFARDVAGLKTPRIVPEAH